MTAPEPSAMTRMIAARAKLQDLRDTVSKRTDARSAKIAATLAEIDNDLEAALDIINNVQCILHTQADQL